MTRARVLWLRALPHQLKSEKIDMDPQITISDKEAASLLVLLQFLKTSSAAPEDAEFAHPEGSLDDAEIECLCHRLEAHRQAIVADIQRVGALSSDTDAGPEDAEGGGAPVPYIVRVRASIGADYRVLARSPGQAERKAHRIARRDDWSTRLSDNDSSMDSFVVIDCHREDES